MARGKLYGTVEIVGSKKISQVDLEQNVDKHHVEDLSQIPYEQAWAWVMTNPQKLLSPKRVCPYSHARVWVNLEYPGQARRIKELIDRAGQVGTDADMKDLAKMAGIVDYSKNKNPFWKLQVENTELNKKYMYGAGDIESKRTSLMKALQFALIVAFYKDDIFCMQQMELKEILSEAGAAKTGKIDVLRSRVLHIKVSPIMGSAEKCQTGTEQVQKVQSQKKTSPVIQVKEKGTHVHGDEQKPAEAPKGVEKSKRLVQPTSMSCSYFEACLCNWRVVYVVDGATPTKFDPVYLTTPSVVIHCMCYWCYTVCKIV